MINAGLHFWSENWGPFLFQYRHPSDLPANIVQLGHCSDFFPWRESIETENIGLSKF